VSESRSSSLISRKVVHTFRRASPEVQKRRIEGAQGGSREGRPLDNTPIETCITGVSGVCQELSIDDLHPVSFFDKERQRLHRCLSSPFHLRFLDPY